jgi:ABC-type uncharacterized transport system permease subunit
VNITLFALIEPAKWFAASIAAAYMGLSYVAWRRTHRVDSAHITVVTPQLEQWALLFVAIAHSALLAAMLPAAHLGAALNLGFAQALSLAACMGVWLFWIESRWVAIDGLRPLALSLPTVAVLLGVWVTPTPVQLHGWAALHVLLAIAAHGVALLAAGHAVLLLALSKVLRQTEPRAWARSLAKHCPPLVMLEKLLLHMCGWMGALLSMTVLLGLLGGHGRFDHKTVLTLLSLATWMIVFWGYTQRSWRGLAICRGVWLATVFLLLAYIGSRFVMQAILLR